MKRLQLVSALALAFCTTPGLAVGATLEEKLEILQREIDELKGEVARLKGQQAPQTQPQGEVSAATEADAYGSQKFALAPPGGNTLGGYGELHYNNFRDDSVKDEIDFHRFVIFYGHKFNDRLRFYSEVEIEHSLVGEEADGEVELEQAFIDYRVNDRVNFKTGLFLIPLGILNETHEPPTFFGVERNEVESRIIPTTWWEGGVGVFGEIVPGLRYDVGITSSLDAGRFENAGNAIRTMRQKVSEANASDAAFYGSINYRGIPGLLLGGGVFSGDTGQDGASDSALKGVDARVTLWDIHAKYMLGNLELQGLYARGTLGDADQVTAAAIARTGDAKLIAAESFYGWYGQAAYHFPLGEMDLAPFVRYERYDTQASVPNAFSADPKNNERVTTFGINFKLHPQVVLKADYQDFKEDNNKDRVNLGMGYLF